MIVGRGGRHIAEKNALDHVFGYSIFNDATVREFQRKSSQWTPGKNFDDTGAVGPWIMTTDELPPGAKGLKIESRLNGNVMQSSNTSNMICSVAHNHFTTQPIYDPGGWRHDCDGYARRCWLRAQASCVHCSLASVIEVKIEGIGALAQSD